MTELLKTIVSGLVEDKDSIEVVKDEPRVIGKQGRIAKAIRTVMRAAATKANEKIMVEID